MTVEEYRLLALGSRALSSGEYRVLSALLSFLQSEDLDPVRPSRRQLAEAAGRKPSSVRTPLQGLEQRGWIEVRPTVYDDGSNGPNVYSFRVPEDGP